MSTRLRAQHDAFARRMDADPRAERLHPQQEQPSQAPETRTFAGVEHVFYGEAPTRPAARVHAERMQREGKIRRFALVRGSPPEGGYRIYVVYPEGEGG